MRIGVLTTCFPRDDHDIAGHFVLGSCQALIARGHHIEVLAPDDNITRPSRNTLHRSGLTVHRVAYLRPRSLQRTFYGAGVPDNLRTDPRAWLGLAPFTVAMAAHVARRSQHWDAVISHWALPCALLARLRPQGSRHLSVLHSADVHLLRRLPGRSQLARSVLGSADHLLFTSEALRSTFAECLRPRDRAVLLRRSHCSPMGVDDCPRLTDRSALRARFGLSRFTAIVLSRLVTVKGIEHAIESVRGTSIDLVIAGDGPERGRLQSLASDLRSQVRFVGWTIGADKHALLRAADAVLVPSIVLASGRTEGVPTVAIEAMVVRTPVVASDVGGVASLIDHGHNGLLVPPGNPQALRAALVQLQGDARLRAELTENATITSNHHRWPEVIQRWEQALRPGPSLGS